MVSYSDISAATDSVLAVTAYHETRTETSTVTDNVDGLILWQLIDDSQTASWGSISNTQTPNWSSIST